MSGTTTHTVRAVNRPTARWAGISTRGTVPFSAGVCGGEGDVLSAVDWRPFPRPTGAGRLLMMVMAAQVISACFSSRGS